MAVAATVFMVLPYLSSKGIYDTEAVDIRLIRHGRAYDQNWLHVMNCAAVRP